MIAILTVACEKGSMNQRTRPRKPRSLADAIRKVTSPIFRKRGFVEQEMLTRWPVIVGEVVAQNSQPERVSFPREGREGGTLFLKASGAFALELQHLEPQILERINAYYGYRAVTKIAIKQGTIVREPVAIKRIPKPLSADQRDTIDTATRNTRDPRLRDALKAVGTHIMGDQK